MTGQVSTQGGWKDNVPQVCGADSPAGCQDKSTYPLTSDCESNKDDDCKQDPISGWDQKYVGMISGSKPTDCTPVKDTGYYTTTNQYDNTAFMNYLTIDAVPDYAKSVADSYDQVNALDPSVSTDTPKNEIAPDPAVAALSNYYLDATRFIGGTLGCPDFIIPHHGAIPDDPQDWHSRRVFQTFVDWMSDKAGYCYYYYVLNRAAKPWLSLDRPGLSTDDPLTNADPNAAVLQTCQPMIHGFAADKLEFPDSEKASKGNMTKYEVRSGFADVRYNPYRPDANEGEYEIGPYLKAEWQSIFGSPGPFTGGGKYQMDPKLLKDVSGSDDSVTKDFKDTYDNLTHISMPCLVQNITALGIAGGVWGYVDYRGSEGTSSCTQTCGVDPVDGVDKCYTTCTQICPDTECKVYYHSAPSIVFQQAQTRQDFCPNVERVIDPILPFSPRNQLIYDTQSMAMSRVWDGEYPSSAVNVNPQPASSDRAYSWFTSIYYKEWATNAPAGQQENNACYYDTCGYTSYNCIMPLDCYQCGEWSWTTNLKIKYPPVQCAVVPVDILTFRFEGFNACIMQRIAINFNRWIDAHSPNFNGTLYYDDQSGNKGLPDIEGINKEMAKKWMNSGGERKKYGQYPDPSLAWGVWGEDSDGRQGWADPNLADRYGYGYAPRGGQNFKPACSTRYWETDNAVDCPTPTSIQQCCRFILKDLVPINYLKIRTCEGLLEARRAGASQDHQGTDLDSRLRKLNFWGVGLQPDALYDPDAHYQKGGNPPPTTKAIAWITDDTVGAPYGAILSWYGGQDGIAQHVLAEAATRMLNDYNCFSGLSQTYKSAPENFFARSPGVAQFSDPYSSELVGVHMPYMRWWDTGVSAGNPHRGGSFTNTLGGWDAFIGVGREEVSQTDAYYANNYSNDPNFEKSHLDGTKYRIAQRASEVARIDGWRGILAHQMQSVRRYGLNCLTRFEKTSKPYSSEDFVLASAGGSYNNKMGEKMPWPFGWRGYLSASTNYGPSLINYANVDMSDSGGGGVTLKGLDFARKGDIIFYPLSDYKYHVAYVEEAGYTPDTDRGGASDESWDFEKGEFPSMSSKPVNDLYVVSWDQGRFPTATGATTYLGIGARHQILKEKVPSYYQQKVCNKTLRALTEKGPAEGDDADIEKNSCSDPSSSENDASGCASNECQPSCDDPDYKYCVLPTFGNKKGWDYAIIYRPSIHDWAARPGLSDTQDWWDEQIKHPDEVVKAPDNMYDEDSNEGVVLQGMTYKYYSSTFASLANEGMDPPWFWFMGNYKGPGTGAITKLTFIGGKWGKNNSSAPSNIVRCFKGNGDGGIACDIVLPQIPIY